MEELMRCSCTRYSLNLILNFLGEDSAEQPERESGYVVLSKNPTTPHAYDILFIIYKPYAPNHYKPYSIVSFKSKGITFLFVRKLIAQTISFKNIFNNSGLKLFHHFCVPFRFE